MDNAPMTLEHLLPSTIQQWARAEDERELLPVAALVL